MTHPPGAVIIPCQETARYHRFTLSLANLELPPGSQRIFGIGTSIVANLNDAIRQMRPEHEWIWIVGDDHVFKPDTLTRLLDRDADMIAPLCVRRGPPFPLVHYDDYGNIPLAELPDDNDPVEVTVTGSLPLIRRHVLDAVGDPWFTSTPGKMDEEFRFCAQVREAGFRVAVDPAVRVGHIDQVIAYPDREDDTWGLRLWFVGADPQSIFYPGGIRERAEAVTTT